MKYTVRTSIVEVIGSLWMPNTTAAMSYTLTDHDVDKARDEDGKVTRESVENWLGSHAGDFASIDDFSASIEDGDETVDLPWASEDSEFVYHDCMYGEED